MDWFHSLNKPFLTPPDALFLPAWIILYILITVSFILFIKGGNIKQKRIPLTCFIIQLLLNFSWPFVFFNLQNIGAALVIITLMWFFILFTIITFFKHSKAASILLLPYLLWSSFAFYLNFAYFVLN